MPATIRYGVVREPGLLRGTTTGLPGLLDGPSFSAPVGQELRNSYVITKSPEHAPLRRFFKAAVDQLQMQFDMSVVTSVQPQSLIAQMRAAVADCDDVSSDGSVMLLSPPRDIPEAELPAGSWKSECGTWNPRRYVETSDTGKSTSTTPGGRPPGCLYTTTCDVATGGA